MTELRLPFRFHARVLPGPRHRKTRSCYVRSEVYVDVPDLCAADFEEVIRLPPFSQRFWEWSEPVAEPLSIYRRKGGTALFAPLLHRNGPVDLERLRELTREPTSASGRLWWPMPHNMDLQQYPVPHTRHRSAWHNALRTPCLATRARFEAWPAPRIVATDLSERELDAAAYLSRAFAIVDGKVWAECPEPVWMVRHVEDRRYELAIMRQPWHHAAHAFFRLDRHDAALEYAEARRQRIQPTDCHGGVDIIEPSAVTRDDAWEIGAAAARNWPRLRRCFARFELETIPGVEGELERLAGNGQEPPRWELPGLMERIAAVIAGPGLKTDFRAERYDELGAVVEGWRRWAWENPNERDFAIFSDDDLEALAEIEWSSV